MTILRGFTLLITLLVTSCTSAPTTSPEYERKLNTWIGRSPHELVEAWGVPSGTWTFEDGTMALRYYRSTVKWVPGFPNPVQTDDPRYAPKDSYYPVDCETVFKARSDRIVWWSYKGNAC